MKITKTIALSFVLLLLTIGNAFTQNTASSIPKIIEKDGHHALLVDGKPYLILGGQIHNSSAWPGMLPQVWTDRDAGRYLAIRSGSAPYIGNQIGAASPVGTVRFFNRQYIAQPGAAA